MTRVMPLALQIFLLKKLFLKCNEDWEDNSAEMDNIDWYILDGTQTFNENLQMLKNNYPKYHWKDWKKELKIWGKEKEREEAAGIQRLTARAKIQHEAEFEEETVCAPAEML